MLLNISVLILTKNEEQDLPGCLESVGWSDDVHILDSESTDRTEAIAKEHSAHFHVRPFDNYSLQRNHGLHQLPYKHDWLLILDADERVPSELRDEFARVLKSLGNDSEVTAFRIRRRDFFMGTWLKHVQTSPWYIRLVRPDKSRYTPRIVNEVLETDGKIIDLDQPFDHFPFSKGMTHWFDKHNRYSAMEAQIIVDNRKKGETFSLAKAFFENDFNKRRWHQKELFYRLPFRPFIKFVILYILKKGFLDGEAGYLYAKMQSIYESMIVVKTKAMEIQEVESLDHP